MGNLKVYQWEREKYPAEQKILVPVNERVPLTMAIAKHLNIPVRQVSLRRRNGGGQYWGDGVILLPVPDKECSLGTIYHELAHALNHRRNGEHGHTGQFKNCVGLVYSFANADLEQIWTKVRSDLSLQHTEAVKVQEHMMARASKVAMRRLEQKALKATSSYKIAKVEAKIKRLESKAKRIENLLKSYRRSLVHLRRYETIRNKKYVPEIESLGAK